MYGCNKALLLVLSSLLATQVALEIAVLSPMVTHDTVGMCSSRSCMCALLTIYLPAIVLPLPFQVKSCGTSHVSSHMWMYWLPMLAFESTLFMLAIVKAARVARGVASTPNVLVVLLRDSIAYFGGIIAIIIANLVLEAAARVRRIALHRHTHILRYRCGLPAVTCGPHYTVRAIGTTYVHSCLTSNQASRGGAVNIGL